MIDSYAGMNSGSYYYEGNADQHACAGATSLRDARMTSDVTCGFNATAKMLGEEFLDFSVEVEFVFGAPLAMAFVGVECVFNRLVDLAHRGGHLLALARFHPRVVGAMGE
jgi:hypothetical protein